MLQSGLTVFALGFGMVFCVLIILILLIGLISKAAGLINKMVPQKEEKPAAAPVVDTAGATDLTPEALAAITAALATALGKDVGQLIIRDIKRA
ncbi:MAG: OadG family protein [Clostridia bacterium]|nr:OadG family protein [Clostridia bacterium]